MKISRFLPSLLLSALPLLLGAPLQAEPIQIMPLGDSITKGAVDPQPSMSGYRARLFDLLNETKVPYLFIGCTDNNSSNALKAAGQQFHNGLGSWRMDGLRANFEANVQQGGDPNMGGFFMSGGTGALRKPAFPDIVLLLAGTNDLGAGAQQPVLETRMMDILSWFAKNRPKTRVFVGTVPPRGPQKPDYEAYNKRVDAFNDWLIKKVPTLGGQFRLVNIHDIFVDDQKKVKDETSPDGINLSDGIHPSHNGYVAMGDAWFKVIRPFLIARP